MKRLAVVLIALVVMTSCSQSPQKRALRYQPIHIKNGLYRFDLSTWPYSLAEFKAQHQESLRIVAFGPMYDTDFDHVIGMLVLTEGVAHEAR